MTEQQRDVHRSPNDEYWYQFLSTGATDLETRGRRLFARLADNPRCKTCNAPFEGLGAPLVKLFLGKRQSSFDPHYCNQCTEFMHENPGGAEIKNSMLFADVRGSTALAEGRPPREFSKLIDRFCRQAANVLLAAGALIDRLIGDEVIGIFPPGIAGLIGLAVVSSRRRRSCV